MNDELRYALENVTECLKQETNIVAEIRNERIRNPNNANILDPILEKCEKQRIYFEQWKIRLETYLSHKRDETGS
jgi:hypothetical protein